jgi:hypothetical protein
MDTPLTEEQTDHCLQCGKWLDPLKGRKNRKYCDDTCRSRFHNDMRKNVDEQIVWVNAILAKNFNILKEIYEAARKNKEPASKSITDMYKLGFNFDYYTQVNGLYKFCYYYGYVPGNNVNYMKVVLGFDSFVKKL